MYWKNDTGFTYLEQLIGLSLLSLVVLVLPNIFLVVTTSETSGNDDAIRFFNHVSQDAKGADAIRWKDNELELFIGDTVISYQMRLETRIQRFRDKKGHVVVLEGVDSFSCSRKDVYYTCSLTMDSGKTYKKLIVSMKEWVHVYQTVR
ncbi:ComGF family competence protein [Shouchella sp. 1P09AA]|uniref:ComGF family competence protein n=1 Tax=unclassified Shouchella TaxID=2893065 RepID=UPI00399FF9C3